VELYAVMTELIAAGQSFVVATVVDVHGSTPQKPGSKMLVLEDDTLRGTVGGGAIELQIVQAARALLASDEQSRLIETHLTHELGMCCGGKMKVFLEKHLPAPSLYLFGAGHVARAVALAAKNVGFQVTVVDDRAGWNTAERFPTADARLERDPAGWARQHGGGAHDYYGVMTHDHALDQEIVEALLRKPCAYLGVIGSRRKAERFRTRLKAAGFSEEEVQKLRSPMGVAIGALGPAEIAVSITAELIDVRRSAIARRAARPARAL
jgi:xanthine dehydrogenase accessory factor